MSGILMRSSVICLMLVSCAWSQGTGEGDDGAPTPEPAAPAAAPGVPELLAAMPGATNSFVSFSDVAEVSAKALMFSQRTGISVPIREPALTELLRLRVSARGGLADRGAAGIAYLDPVEFEGRNTVYVLPVQGREPFLEYNAARELEAGLYQIPSAEQPRFFVFEGDYALFTDSVRTTRSVRDGAAGMAGRLSDEQVRAAAGADLYIHLGLAKTLKSRQGAAEAFRMSVARKIMGDPTLEAYSDLLFGYVNGIHAVVSQLDSLDLGVTFGAENLGISVRADFAEKKSIFRYLHGLGGQDGGLDGLPLDRSFIAAGSASLNPEMLRLIALQAVDFLMQQSPRSKKGVRPQTRDELLGALDDMLAQCTGTLQFMKALPRPDSGAAEAAVTVVNLRDMKAFVDARGALFKVMGTVVGEVGSRASLSYLPGKESYREVKVDHLIPKVRFVRNEQRKLFEKRAKEVYGPDGFLYRMATVEDRLFVTVGSDLSLFHAAIDKALDDGSAEPPEALEAVAAELPETRHVEYYASLPAVVSRSMLMAGPAGGAARGPIHFDEEDRHLLEAQGLVGLAVSLAGGAVQVDTRVGYDQLAAAVSFAERHLPSEEPAGPTPEPREPPTSEETSPPAGEPTPEPAPAEEGAQPEPAE